MLSMEARVSVVEADCDCAFLATFWMLAFISWSVEVMPSTAATVASFPLAARPVARATESLPVATSSAAACTCRTMSRRPAETRLNAFEIS
jgi:hypothetical protein